MHVKREELCLFSMGFAWQAGVAKARRTLAGKMLSAEPEDFCAWILSQLAAALGGPFLDTEVQGVGFTALGMPEPLVRLLSLHLPRSPAEAQEILLPYRWTGPLPPAPNFRKGARNGKGT